MSQILVIGGGPAGTFAAIAAKKHDPSATVTLLTLEPYEPYEKPPLSKAVLLGTAAPGDALIAGPAGVAAHGVALRTHARVASIDREQHVAVLAGGEQVRYDTLVIATGSTAREIPQLPAGTPNVHYLRSEADARTLEQRLRETRHLLVVGAGLIGLEVAASAAMRGVTVTVLEVATRILARVCDERTAAAVHAVHERHGVDIRLNTIVTAASVQNGGAIAVETMAGDRVVTETVVVGTGSKPDVALAAASGLEIDDGIVVDAHCRTSDPSIFAAGDAVRFPGPDGPIRLENWRHALDQGTVAGRNAAGGAETYATVPSFWSEQFDLYIQGIGWPTQGTTRVHRGGSGALVFDLHAGRIVHAMGINAQRDLAAARRLIERQILVDAVELADSAKPLNALLKRHA